MSVIQPDPQPSTDDDAGHGVETGGQAHDRLDRQATAATRQARARHQQRVAGFAASLIVIAIVAIIVTVIRDGGL